MADLGDLSDFLKGGSLSNLDWLDLGDGSDYRAADKLPKQNLDTQPDLQGLWAREDKATTTYLVPNKGPVEPWQGAGEVHTMGDLSQAHGRLSDKAEDIAKVTRYAMMQSNDSDNLRRVLTAKFDLQTLRANRQVIAGVLQERGLLGPVYIQASDFSNCHNSPKAAKAFVRKYACDAKYLVAKPECAGCIHAKKHGNTTNCAVFHKQVVLDVPYTEQLANEIENLQKTRGKVMASTGGSPKERIRLAMLSQTPATTTQVYSGVGENQLPAQVSLPKEGIQEQLIQASALTRKRDEEARLAVAAKPVVTFIRRELLKGRTASELVRDLKVSFPMNVLAETRAAWEPQFKEAGLYGSIYSTQDSFEDCREGADFLAKHNPGVRAMVAGPKCGSCIYNKISRCMLYGKPLVKEAADVYTWTTVEAVLDEHRMSGRLPAWEKSATLQASDPRDALKIIHQRVNSNVGMPQKVGHAERMDIFHQWAGSTQSHVASGQVKREIVKTAARYLNEGLYGQDLLRALKARFEVRDLAGARTELKAVLAEQGLQGIYYVDASAYDDYGHGCEEPARLFRAKQVPYAKFGPKCASCVHNHNQTCSKLNKPLVVEPPYVNKAAQQREILASGLSTEVSPASLLAPSGLTMMVEYELQNNDGMTFDLDPVVASTPVEMIIGQSKIKV
jgi:hypothetical protein